MNGLALCAGIGGLELGLKRVWPDLRTVCWVERDSYAALVIAQRQVDGLLALAPIWDDLTTFDAGAWRGAVDLVSAGFPCQPWSVAGKRRGVRDDRWLWEHIADIIRDVGPEWVVLENVPGLVTGGGASRVLGSLAEIGFDAEWGCFTASEVGAPHKRERWFCVAHARCAALSGRSGPGEARSTLAEAEAAMRREERQRSGNSACDGREAVADSSSSRRNGRQDIGAGRADARERPRGLQPERGCRELAYANQSERGGLSERAGEEYTVVGVTGGVCDADCARENALTEAGGSRRAARQPGGFQRPYPPGKDDADAWQRLLAEDTALAPAVESGVEPDFRGVAYGLPARLVRRLRRERLRCLGNAVVPAQAACAVRELVRRLVDEQ